MDSNDQFDIETEMLQADVMRFLAIIAFSLLIIFIPLIQTIRLQPQLENKSVIQVAGTMDIEQEEIKPENQPENDAKFAARREQDKTSEKSDNKELIMNKAAVAKEKQSTPIQKEKTKPAKIIGSKKKSRQLFFDEGAFQALLSNGSIKGYVILPDNDLSFEFKYIKDQFLFLKNSPQNVNAVLGLRKSTLPSNLIPSFERFYPSLAMQKKEFYFVPSGKIRAELNRIHKSPEYGRFKIMENEGIIHEE